jgi:NAD(P)-dependent dehydrogenase (short-subunit alcohol dehydrogenase family)
MSKVWLITGSGNGLGRDIAEAALAAGNSVVAGARRTEELAPLVAQHGERVKPVKLEVRDEAAAKAAVQLAVDTFGRLDVLVNNAGYGQFAPFEQMSAEDFQAIMDTCFYGVVYTTRAAVPVMRKQKSGHIFQVSSVGGRHAVPGNTPYHAAKWAVGGFSDSLAIEVAPFGVKVCTLEPGGIRTNWARRAVQNAPDLLPEYEASVGSFMKMLRGLDGGLEGDPRKIAELLSHSSRPCRSCDYQRASCSENRITLRAEAFDRACRECRSPCRFVRGDEPIPSTLTREGTPFHQLTQSGDYT